MYRTRLLDLAILYHLQFLLRDSATTVADLAIPPLIRGVGTVSRGQVLVLAMLSYLRLAAAGTAATVTDLTTSPPIRSRRSVKKGQGQIMPSPSSYTQRRHYRL